MIYLFFLISTETKWESPAVGYISIAEQKVLEEAESSKSDSKDFKRDKSKKFSAGKKRKTSYDFAVSADKNKSCESKKLETSKKSVSQKADIVMGPAPKPNPYGLWKTIETK